MRSRLMRRHPPSCQCTWPSTRPPGRGPSSTRRSSDLPEALSATCGELPAVHYAITSLGGPVRVAAYTRFGSAGLADAAVAALEGRQAAILQNHGAVCHGPTLAAAYDRAVLLEWLARVYR